jgi:hypothetical protein
MIKEFTPLLGYISWYSLQWIFFINAQSVKINDLQCSECEMDGFNGSITSKNPYLGSSCTWFGKKMSWNQSLEVSPNSLLSLLAKTHPEWLNLAFGCFLCLKPEHMHIPQKWALCHTVNAISTPKGGCVARMCSMCLGPRHLS